MAFAATTSIACAGLVLSYALPILFRLVSAGQLDEIGPFSLGRYAKLLVQGLAASGLTWKTWLGTDLHGHDMH